MLMVKFTTSIFDMFKTSLTSLFLVLSIILLIIPGELFSQSNSYTNAQIQQIEQNVLESLIDENHQEFLHQLEELRATGVSIHHELLFYEAKANRSLSNFQEAFLAIDFYLNHQGNQLHRKSSAEALLAQLEVDFEGMWEEEERIYERALQNRQLHNVRHYFDQYPEGRYTSEMNELHEIIEEEYFQRAKRTDTRNDYRIYLNQFPEGIYKNTALERYNQLERIDQLTRLENELTTNLEEQLERRGTYRMFYIFSGAFSIAAGAVTYGIFTSDDEDIHKYGYYSVAATGVYSAITIYNIIRATRSNRVINLTRQRLTETSNLKEQLRNNFSFSPHINPLEGSYALSFQIRF